MSAPFETIQYREEEGVATLTLNRPERLNSFSRQMHAEIRVALDQLRASRAAGTVRVLVITGAGRAFCSGQDLSERQPGADGSPPDLGLSIERDYKPLVLALRALDLPVIAAVNGVAAGGGANFALAADLVFAARSASFIQPFCKLGLIPDTGGSWVLPRLIGPARALGLSLLGDKLSAAEAEAWGLIWKCVDDAELMPTVASVAARLAAGPTRGYARTKQAIWSSSTRTFEEQLDVERDYMGELSHSADYREGVAAFLEKRPAAFRGA